MNQDAYLKKAGAAYGTPTGGIMCTGPYKLGSWKSGDSVTLERNDAYWDPQIKPKAGQVVFRFVTNSNTLTSALLSGEVDGVYELPPTSATALAKAGNGATYLGPATQNVMLVPGNAQSPAADRRLLDALSLAVDRDALITNVFGGAAALLKSLAPPLTWGGDPAAVQLNAAYAALPAVEQPDIARAKQLVAQAGAPSRPLVAAIPAGDQRSLADHDLRPGRGKEGRRRPADQAAPAHRDVLAVLRPVHPAGTRPHPHVRLRRRARRDRVRRRHGHARRAVQLDELRQRRRDPAARTSPFDVRPGRVRAGVHRRAVPLRADRPGRLPRRPLRTHVQ
ncbi:ABC transporter substrate-binding protein [Yinghuangia aomiensis]